MPMLVKIGVPYTPQWGTGASRYNADCGPACVAMCLALYDRLAGYTVDQLAAQTGLSSNDVGLTPTQLVALALRHGLRAMFRVGVTPETIRSEINAGRPVIALISYHAILGRLDQGDYIPGSDGHFVVVVGYSEGPGESCFILNDPDFWQPYTQRGHDFFVPVTQLEDGLTYFGSQCVLMETPMSLRDQYKSLGQQIITLADDIPDTPVPVSTELNCNTAKLNVRRAAGVGDNVVGWLELNDVIAVIDATVAGWKQIVSGTIHTLSGTASGAGYFVSGAYLSPNR